ncbi:putative Dim1 family, thioredoxin-like protein [Medicago truncatula]|uniref:Putative Dim1 family, thioredoxin-like protein n=1 Tax=Medicago truncatula TaxID=3880 RepID=A0A396IBH8_MEDTR|nr:putative Dim1 family, thioredoxin-like protein [Medicago truncatula]
MSYLLPHLHSGWAVDQAILCEEERLVVIRFGHDWDDTCMQVRAYLYSYNMVKKLFTYINFTTMFFAYILSWGE